MVQRDGGSVAVWCDRLLDAVVVLLATWTLVYDVCLVARLSTTTALALEVVTLALTVLLLRRVGTASVTEDAVTSDPAPAGPRSHDPVERGLLLVTAAAALAAAVATGFDAWWALVWVP